MPRSTTFVLNKDKVRKYGALTVDKDKLAQEGFDTKGTNWLKDIDGNIIETTLFTKMMVLVANKFSLLDPMGMGIEMEGGRPGWNDAMNGLPGIFGSGMSETLELVRLIKFVLESIENREEAIILPAELSTFVQELYLATKIEDDYKFWDSISTAREQYAEVTRLSLSGKETSINILGLRTILEAFLEKLKAGMDRAIEIGNGVMPTFFAYEATKYEMRVDENGEQIISHYGLPTVDVLEFKLNPIPNFLEGPAKVLKQLPIEEARKMHNAVKDTDIYDPQLKMFKTSGTLEDVTHETGRIRAFTAGWLERESVFLHLEYKYFYGLLRANLYEEFFECINDALIPFLNPQVYGRSTLENSSFIASSVNPDPATHGRGFVARLTGAGAEMMSMWIKMFVGNDGGFKVEEDKLTFKFAPVLPNWLFDEEGEASFTLLANTKVTYINPSKINTFDGLGATKVQYSINGNIVELDGNCIVDDAENLRNGNIEWIKVTLG